ncbi:hypothetical protein C6A86_012265 [Mycobacterium sp. ITM-2016-00316]|uniref:hypothetical protein n=1 Tax=Mycobacterium sp. ITM-2016-00316 TaxID=2099695 RepID=UPI000CF85EF8|nr:hypothetical protein [Mycobacterium sp. ITM-2016-00316]WNG84350.1 hypothetical protein C6A86_012265 [Mycobacterium sp. ITM-2016-00316]
MSDTRVRPARGGRLAISRSRGALSGFLLILLGLWGAFIPFVGPYFDFAYTPDSPWTWTLGRGWLEVLPGVVAVIGGLLLLVSRNRATAMLGGWLAVAAGAWFVVGRALAAPLALGNVGNPVAVTEAKRVVLELAYFSGLGALIVFLAAVAVGRLSVRSVRDVEIGHTETATPVATTGAQPVVMPDQKTEVIGPTAEAGRKRGWRGIFGRRDRNSELAHH